MIALLVFRYLTRVHFESKISYTGDLHLITQCIIDIILLIHNNTYTTGLSLLNLQVEIILEIT